MTQSDNYDRSTRRVEELEPDMVELQRRLVALPAIGPTSGGEGERARVDLLRPMLEGWGLEVTEYRAPDPRVSCGYRPSLVARLPGEKSGPALWIMTHLDVVPAGPRELWHSEPHEAVVKDGLIYGRGTEDNQQEMVASIHSVRALLDCGIKPKSDVYLMLAADEENGSEFGADWLLKNHQLCRLEDLVLVPDAGNEQGTMMEVAEKSIAWVKVSVTGRQSHASAPSRNAHRAGANLIVRLDERLHKKYSAKDALFSPPESTIEPTKKLGNVPNVNTIPGEDVFWFDCRMLPEYRLEQVVADFRSIAEETAEEFGVGVKVETEQLAQAAPATSPDAPVVRLLAEAVRGVLGRDAKPAGIGGGTVAAFFRRLGIPAVVWGRTGGRAHNPDEYCTIANMVGDAKVYLWMMLNAGGLTRACRPVN